MSVATVGGPVDLVRRVGPVFAADPRVRFAYLFGSMARGEQWVGSDVDWRCR